jgi:Zn ribbon nucleic-acid-binding protein
MPSHTAQCPKCNELIDLQMTAEQCIEEHECFDDDPCPLEGQFLKSANKACPEKKTCSKCKSE